MALHYPSKQPGEIFKTFAVTILSGTEEPDRDYNCERQKVVSMVPPGVEPAAPKKAKSK